MRRYCKGRDVFPGGGTVSAGESLVVRRDGMYAVHGEVEEREGYLNVAGGGEQT